MKRNHHHQLSIVAICAAILLMIVACSASSSSTHHSLTSKLQCGVAYAHWRNNGGKQLLVAIEAQMGPITQALQSGNVVHMKKVSVALSKDTARLEKNMPPNCVPNADSDLKVLLNNLNNAAQEAAQNRLTQAKQSLQTAGNNATKLGHDFTAYAK